ncbi:nonsense-mediated mRNA decay factor SMG5 isoform X1 [Lethenteron reissneri]|uniref:nonsense-mediated mRNA decay factor SMG5 isoform X1 n=1 Tax=Lethenteron reissneri TaxID=7753 RepID=UPI002AB7D0BA|nr:nonsense-mediated mRNA decay factor SMG5 isoform X1 [Lethenteron reissneri]
MTTTSDSCCLPMAEAAPPAPPAAPLPPHDSPRIVQTKRLYRAVVDVVHRLDTIISSSSVCQEVFKPENVSQRNKLRELCVKLMFLHPVDYGRKAEELLWRKVYYEVIHAVKANRKQLQTRGSMECAYRTHLVAGVGFYQHLLLTLQSHYQLELQACIDWTHVVDTLSAVKKPAMVSSRALEWARMACHHCLIYLGDLARYQNELGVIDTHHLSERFYLQALAVAPHVGMPLNQLGTLAGNRSYNVEAAYYYMRCIQSEVGFDGAVGNMRRVFIKAKKMYMELLKKEAPCKKASLSKQRSRDLKKLLVSFLYLQSLLHPTSSVSEAEVTSLCQAVLHDFNLCMFYLPAAGANAGAGPEDHDAPCLSHLLVFRMLVLCLMGLHGLKRAGSKQFTTAVAFTLALFSHLLNHLIMRLQVEMDDLESIVPALPPSEEDGNTVVNKTGRSASAARPGTEEVTGTAAPKDEASAPVEAQSSAVVESVPPPLQKKRGKLEPKTSRLRWRRRRRGSGSGESDLSEDFDSDDDGDEGGDRGDGESEGASNSEFCLQEEDEEVAAAFGSDSESDMNSQESRSDLDDVDGEDDEEEEEEAEDKEEDEVDNEKEEKKKILKVSEEVQRTKEVEGQAEGTKEGDCTKQESPQIDTVAQNGALTATEEVNLGTIASSLQMFQSRRSYRLAPAFEPSTVSQPAQDSQPLPVPTVEAIKPSENGEDIRPMDNEQNSTLADLNTGNGSVSSEETRSTPSEGEPGPLRERTTDETLNILCREGLLPSVKVFLDWLRINPDIVRTCAPSSQNLWNRLSVLLNILPDSTKLMAAGTQLPPGAVRFVSGCERGEQRPAVALPEDVALRRLLALRESHARMLSSETAWQEPLSPLQQTVVRAACLRCMGHHFAALNTGVLHYSTELSIFLGSSSAVESEGGTGEDTGVKDAMQQAEMQLKMAEEELRRNRLMRDMAQLRLEEEVRELEGSLRSPGTSASLSPYLVPDAGVLSQHLQLVRQLAASARFILLIPRAVIDGLDVMKKDEATARDAIRFLEGEFKKGSRYIRCQRESGKVPDRHRLKRQDPEAWRMYRILDGCKQLTVAQGGAEESAGMVTILLACQPQDTQALTPNLQDAIREAQESGIHVRNVQDFYRQWRELG